MFLIAKIVRGRRLLHELEREEKEQNKEREREREREKAEKENRTEGGLQPPNGEGQSSADLGSAPRRRFSREQRIHHQHSLSGERWGDQSPDEEENNDTTSESLPTSSMDAGKLERRKTWTTERSRLPLIGGGSLDSSASSISQKQQQQKEEDLNAEKTVRLLPSIPPILQTGRNSFRAPSPTKRVRIQLTRDSGASGRRTLPLPGHQASQDGDGYKSVLKAVRQQTAIPLDDAEADELEDQLDHDQQPGSSRYALSGGRLRRTSSMPSVTLDASTTGERLRHYNYDAKLNRLQKRALRFTWTRLHTRNGGKRVEQVFDEVYDRVVKTTPVCSQMFTTRVFLSAMAKADASATQRAHARLTVRMFDIIIKSLDCDEKRRLDTGSKFDPIRVGRAHAPLRPYGFVSAFWEKLGETIIDVVLCQEAVRDLPGASQAWVVLTACVVDQLRAGFENARDISQQRSLTSSSHAAPCPQHMNPRPSCAGQISANLPRTTPRASAAEKGEVTAGDGDGVSRRGSSQMACSSAPSLGSVIRLATTESLGSSHQQNSRLSTPDSSMLSINFPLVGESSSNEQPNSSTFTEPGSSYLSGT